MTDVPQLSNSPSTDGSSALAPLSAAPRLSMIGRRRSIFDLTPDELDRVKNLAKMFAAAKTLKIINTGEGTNKVLDEGEYFLIILQGLALGIDPMVAPNFFNVIYGRVTINTQGMMALIHQSGLLEDLKVTLVPGQYAEVTMKRAGIAEPYTARFSIEDAAKMNLLGKDNWKKQPDTMLVNRAESKCARVLWADIINGLYTSEEMQDSVMVEPVAAPMEGTPQPPRLVPRTEDDKRKKLDPDKYQKLDPEDEYEPPFPAGDNNSPTGEPDPDDKPAAAPHWALDPANQKALVAFLKEHGYETIEAGKALMEKLHPGKQIAKWSETSMTFDELKAAIIAIKTQPAPVAPTNWAVVKGDDYVTFLEDMWGFYNRDPQEFLTILSKQDWSEFPSVDAAATAAIGVAKSQGWPVVARKARYTKSGANTFIEWETPLRVRQYGRSTTFKGLVGDDFYGNNHVENWKPGTSYVVEPPLLIHWEAKGDGAEYLVATSYEIMESSDIMPWDEEPSE